jgi:16S rRNA C1402 (ribose-2'-O) methylase RsmI
MTKVHQEFVAGDSASVIGHITNIKGEFTVVIGPPVKRKSLETSPSEKELFDEFCHMTHKRPDRRASAAVLAKKYGLTTNFVYAAIERCRKTDE